MVEVDPHQLAQSMGLSKDWADRLARALQRSFMGRTILNAAVAKTNGVITNFEEFARTCNFVCTLAGV